MAWMLCEVIVRLTLSILTERLLETMRRRKVTEKCMIKTCQRLQAAGRRGLCLVCYSGAKAKVESGVTTWDRLVELGLCGSDANPFDDAYSQAMRDPITDVKEDR